MTQSFPYQFIGSYPNGELYRPIVEVKAFDLARKESMTVRLVVDTGADYTLLPKIVATYLGISLEHDCVKDVTQGIGGNEDVYFLKKHMKIQLGKFTLDVPVAFMSHNRNPGLMGRLGFLDTFKVTFDKRKVSFSR